MKEERQIADLERRLKVLEDREAHRTRKELRDNLERSVDVANDDRPEPGEWR